MVNFDRFLIKMDEYERKGDIHNTVWALRGMMDTHPNAARNSVEIQHYVENLSWVRDSSRFMEYLDEHRPRSNTDDKDFYNRRVLSLLGEFVENEEFWYKVCLKYPEYLKFYQKANNVFKTAIRIVL